MVVEAPFVYNSRQKTSQRASGGPNQLLGGNARSSLKSQLSLQTLNSAEYDSKTKKKQRQHSHSFGSRNNSMSKVSPQRKPGRPKRDVRDSFLRIPSFRRGLFFSHKIIFYPILHHRIYPRILSIHSLILRLFSNRSLHRLHFVVQHDKHPHLVSIR